MESRKIVYRETGIVAIGVTVCTAVMMLVYALLGRFELSVLWGGLTAVGLALAVQTAREGAVGQAIAYLVAPPVEAVVALDAALKAAEVRLTELYRPPTETNFAGGLLTGTQSACRAACSTSASVAGSNTT